jgi:hypothetical protein
MKSFRDRLLAGLSLAALVFGSPAALAVTVSAGAPDGTPHLLTELLFNATTPMETTRAATSTAPMTSVSLPSTAINTPGWSIGARNGGAVGVQATTGPNGSMVDALEGDYPVAGNGGWYVGANYSVASLNTEDVYIEFWAKMPSQYKGGFKFVKVFGQSSSSTGYANTTFGAEYTASPYGALTQVSFGDGTNLQNDTQNVINLDGQYFQSIGRSYGTAVVQTPQMSDFPAADWGTGWHHFLIHVKFNSGTTSQNEVPNGEYYLQIDGKVYVDATGLYNRNPANRPIEQIGFFGWAQEDPEPFQVWYYDIRISTGGFMDTPLPNPPSNVAVQ